MRYDGSAEKVPAAADPREWAYAQASQARVWDAPGWFATASEGAPGAVQVSLVVALVVSRDPRGRFILVAESGCRGWTLDLGPYADEAHAGMVCQQVLRLASALQDWPGDDQGVVVDRYAFVGEPVPS